MSKAKLHLRVSDVEASTAFYRDTLGWTVEWLRPELRMAQLREPLGLTAILTAEPHPEVQDWMDVAFDEPQPGQRVYLGGDRLPELREELARRGVAGVVWQENPGYGRTLIVPDPDGYLIGLWEELSMPDSDILTHYRQGPDLLESALAGLSESDLDLVRAPGKWSIRQTVLHLVDSDLTTMNRIKFALAEPGRVYRPNPYAPDKWAESTDYGHRPIHTEVALFRLVREHVLGLCQHLPGAMDRFVEQEDGKPQVRDMLKMVAWHVRGHIDQIQETRRVHGR
ncbi:MAG: DinB family protein [Bacillota bacterium]